DTVGENSETAVLARICESLGRIISPTKRRGKSKCSSAPSTFDTAGIWRRLSHLIWLCISMAGDAAVVRFVQSPPRKVSKLFGEPGALFQVSLQPRIVVNRHWSVRRLIKLGPSHPFPPNRRDRCLHSHYPTFLPQRSPD